MAGKKKQNQLLCHTTLSFETVLIFIHLNTPKSAGLVLTVGLIKKIKKNNFKHSSERLSFFDMYFLLITHYTHIITYNKHYQGSKAHYFSTLQYRFHNNMQVAVPLCYTGKNIF